MYIKPTIGGSTRRHFNSLVKFGRKAKKNASKVSPKFEGFLSNIYVKNPSRNILTWIEFSNEETIPGNNATFDLWYKASRYKETLTMGLHKLVHKEYWVSTRVRSINVKKFILHTNAMRYIPKNMKQCQVSTLKLHWLWNLRNGTESFKFSYLICKYKRGFYLLWSY